MCHKSKVKQNHLFLLLENSYEVVNHLGPLLLNFGDLDETSAFIHNLYLFLIQYYLYIQASINFISKYILNVEKIVH